MHILEIIDHQALVKLGIGVADAHRADEIDGFGIAHNAVHQPFEQEHQRQGLFLVFHAHIGAAQLDGLAENPDEIVGIGEQRTGVEAFDAAVAFEDLAADAQPVAAGDALALGVPEDELLVVFVVLVDVDGVVAAFARGAERFFAPAADFDHRDGNVGGVGQEALVTGHVKQLLAGGAQLVEFLDHRFLVARQGDGRDQLRRFGEFFVGVVELRFHRVHAAAQVAAELVDVGVFRQFVGHNGPADAHRDGLALLVEEFVGQVERAQQRMDATYQVKQLRVFRFEIDRYDRYVGVADELDDGVGPGDVLDGMSGQRGPTVGPLVGRDLTGRENTQGAAGGQVLHRLADARQTAASAGKGSVGERVDREKGVLERRDERQQEIGHDLEIGTHRADHGVEDHAVGRADGVVGHHDEGTVLRNVVVLLRIQVVADARVLEDVLRKLGTFVLFAVVVGLVDFVEAEDPHREGSEQPAHGPPHMDELHDIRFID